MDAGRADEQHPPDHPDSGPGGQRGGGATACDCWVTPTSSYHTINNSSEWNAAGFNDLDDGSFGPITLQFPFYLYGQTWTTAYININGNVSFGTFYGNFLSTGFPVPNYTMVAPFWADMDLSGPGVNNNLVQYYNDTHALFVNWTNVGYFPGQTDKVNTFQLIISDGQDPHIPDGANVSFCYQDMQWTTASSSGGVNGFGGTPASVGANNGNGTDYLQFGRFDHAGTDYDGPFDANDGVSWLDYKHFTFTTDVTTGNVPPVISGQTVCDSFDVCVGQLVNMAVTFLSPESDQTTTVSSGPVTLSNFNITQYTTGSSSELLSSFTPGSVDVGYHTINFTGTDDGVPPDSSTLTIVVQVLPPQQLPPDTARICPGDTGIDLFSFFTPTLLDSGTWTAPDGSAFSGIFNANTDTTGNYTYLEPPTPTCPRTIDLLVKSAQIQNTLQIANSTCHGSADGSIAVVTTGDSAVWDYTWTNAADSVLRTTIGSAGDSLGGTPGIYHIHVSEQGDSMACSTDLTATILDPPALIVNPGNDTTVCPTGTAMVSATATGGTGAFQLHWNNGLADADTQYVSPPGTTTYIVYATDSNNCVSDSVTLIVSVFDTLHFFLHDTLDICPGVDLPLIPDSVEGGDGQWTYDWGSGPSPDPAFTVNITATQTFCMTLRDGCETPSVTRCIVAHVIPVPPLALTPDSVLGCEPFLVHFSFEDTSGTATADWDFGDGASSTGLPTSVAHTYNHYGTYTVTVDAHWPNGCSYDTSYSDLITVIDLPHADYSWTPDPASIFENTVQFQELAGPLAASYQWDFADLGSSVLSNPSFTFPNEVGASYPVELLVRNFLGCPDSITKVVEVQDVFLVYVPTAFTPDADGLNDMLKVIGNDIAPDNFHWMIFDRWGEKIFDTTDPLKGWDGKLNGKVVENGVYNWMLRAQSAYTGINHDLVGTVTVVH
jgi:gliding motility-associated-like protein